MLPINGISIYLDGIWHEIIGNIYLIYPFGFVLLSFPVNQGDQFTQCQPVAWWVPCQWRTIYKNRPRSVGYQSHLTDWIHENIKTTWGELNCQFCLTTKNNLDSWKLFGKIRSLLSQDECLPRQKDEVRRIFEQEFQQTPENLFAEFDYRPVAAASLAQVFRAKTKDGQEVAVKVQYIDLVKRFSGDFATILFLQDLIKIIHSDFNFGWILRDLRGNLEQVW